MTGRVLAGRYVLEREIGAGAMGSVHEAVNREDGARVAIKVLRPEFASDSAIRRRFRREVSALRALDHPGIVRVLDFGADDEGRNYLVMERIEGEPLDVRLSRAGRLAPTDAAPILLGVADALSAIHAHGIVHGDVKPGNVFLTTQAPGIKLVDFGLCKIEGLDRLTRTGEVAGTPVYMAPELFTGEGGREPDGRIDVYSLGVVAYQVLSGRLPFDTRKHPGRLMFDVATGNTVPLAEAAPGLSPKIAIAVERAMAARREQRPTDAATLAREWRAAFEVG